MAFKPFAFGTRARHVDIAPFKVGLNLLAHAGELQPGDEKLRPFEFR
jgi:hypothetical protein